MATKVFKPGLATTVQDLGRPGYYHIGVPLSGGMDRHALRGRKRARCKGGRDAARTTGSSTTDRKISSTDSYSVDLTRCRHARARRELIPASSAADRPARAAWSALRLLVDVVIFVLAKLLVGRFWFGADDGVQAVAADVGFAGSVGDGAGADRAQRGTGS